MLTYALEFNRQVVAVHSTVCPNGKYGQNSPTCLFFSRPILARQCWRSSSTFFSIMTRLGFLRFLFCMSCKMWEQTCCHGLDSSHSNSCAKCLVSFRVSESAVNKTDREYWQTWASLTLSLTCNLSSSWVGTSASESRYNNSPLGCQTKKHNQSILYSLRVFFSILFPI